MKSLKVHIRAQLHDAKTGRHIKTFPWHEAHSFVLNFIKILHQVMCGTSILFTDITGTEFTSISEINNLRVNSGAGETNKGILIGTGTTAVAMTDYALETPVTNLITHGAVSFGVETPDANTSVLFFTRSLTNNTGSGISVTEVALYCNIRINITQAKFACIDRSLYSVEFGNGLTLTLTYRITVTL